MKENQIYTTSKYDDFVFRRANREVDERHAKKIAESMKENGWKGSPIEVSLTESGKYQIEDGQHRFTAAKESNIPIKFMLVEPLTIYEVASQNSMKKGWTGKDYISAYASDGNYSYKRIENLIKEFDTLTFQDVIRAVSNTASRTYEKMKKGYISVNDAQFYKAREVLSNLVPMVELIYGMKIKTKENYKKALTNLLKNDVIDADRMADKLEHYGEMLLPKSVTVSQAIEQLEIVYNYRMTKKNVVYFRERLKNI